VTELVLDAARSRIRLHTFAEGLLARLAHDLELVCGDLVGTAVRRRAEGDDGKAWIEVPLRGISVSGVLGKDGRVDDRGLSPTERRDCIAKMHHDVFHAEPDAIVRVEIDREGDSANVRIAPPNGKTFEAKVRPDVRADGDADGLRATGKLEVSLKAIGAGLVKGPLGAFRVKDSVVVLFDVVFAAPAADIEK
jgi:hypothetical protein